MSLEKDIEKRWDFIVGAAAMFIVFLAIGLVFKFANVILGLMGL